MTAKMLTWGIFTATRAQYGLLRPILSAMERSRTLTPRLIVSGTHLSERHGHTAAEIEADGRQPSARVSLPLKDDTPGSVIADMAAVLDGVGRAHQALDLDAILILGDRTEALAAAAAMPLALPIAHIEGGHRTAGAFHLENGASATLCVREHHFQALHGVAEIDGVRLTRLREKPTFRWQANAGIYCLEGFLLSRIPTDGPYDMPELLFALVGRAETVCAYPMHEDWLDIGRPLDFETAQTEFGAVFPR